MSKPTSSNLTAAIIDSTSYTGKSGERATEVLSLLRGRMALEEKTILDLGCGPAPISEFFRQGSTLSVGLDKERRYLRQARAKRSLELVWGDATSLPFRDESFGFVLCNDVLEHVFDQAKLMQELIRVLARNGAAYVQCANKYQIIEPHFLLPFLSWIPRPLANIYVKVARKGKSYEGYFPKTRRGVLALANIYRTVDLTYERTLMKIRSLNIQSNVLRGIVLVARRILSDEFLATLAQNFSIVSILVMKD